MLAPCLTVQTLCSAEAAVTMLMLLCTALAHLPVDLSIINGAKPSVIPTLMSVFVFLVHQGVARPAPAAAAPLQLTCPGPHTQCQTSPTPPARMSFMMLTSITRAALHPNTAQSECFCIFHHLLWIYFVH